MAKINRVKREMLDPIAYLNDRRMEYIRHVEKIAKAKIFQDEAPGKSVNLRAVGILLSKCLPDQTKTEHYGKISIDAIRIVHEK